MRVLYRFGDNDFRSTFIEVFRVIQRRIEHHDCNIDKLRDKEFVCSLINELAYPIYRTIQCRHFPDFDGKRFSSEEEHRSFYMEYFHATPDTIYLDREIEELIEKFSSNGGYFVLDSDQHDPEWRVYAL